MGDGSICDWQECQRALGDRFVVLGAVEPGFDRIGFDDATTAYRKRAWEEAVRGNEQEILPKPQGMDYVIPPRYVEKQRFCTNACMIHWLVDELDRYAD